MPSQLISHDTEVIETVYPLDSLPIIIGRGPLAGIRLTDRWSSRANSEILEIDGALFVRDLNSSNGTLVNGVHVMQSHLLPGDKLTVGMSTFIVSEDADALERAASSATLTLRSAADSQRPISSRLATSKPR
jgi:pSer/pThr/pTyr-binding forkhead associated (FHA) protein